jgi:hypothetical protein
MHFTQVELTSPSGIIEVWWLPVPEGKAKVGEKIANNGVDWTITQVCTTLLEKDIPKPSRVAFHFKRDEMTVAEMSI